MSLFSSESAWLCLAAAAVLGGMLLCKSWSPGQLRSHVVCLAGLWGGACLLSLSLLCSLFLLSVFCFLLYMSSSDQDLLPVDQKAVLVTGPGSLWNNIMDKKLPTCPMGWSQCPIPCGYLSSYISFCKKIIEHTSCSSFIFTVLLGAMKELRLVVYGLDRPTAEEDKEGSSGSAPQDS